MASPYLGEIRLFGGNFPPRGWALCNGQILSIQQNTALFALLGTQFGGNGVTNFQLPDLQSRVPIHQGFSPNGLSYEMGQTGGEEQVTLSYAQLPVHNHLSGSVNQASTRSPGGAAFAAMPRRGVARYAPPSAGLQINDGPGSSTGGSQPHSNLQPYLVVTFIIALVGIFPARN